MSHTAAPDTPASDARHAEPTDANIRELVYAFYDRVRDDALLGPVFEAKLAGRWDDHLPKMCRFWSSLVLGSKTYRGNVQQAHQPLDGLEPRHFSQWLYLFLDTVERRFQPAAALRFMEPALRIAQSLQLSQFGWDFTIPAEQQALLAQIAPRRHAPHAPVDDTPRGEPFPVKIVGHAQPTDA
ncbi:MAG TPA: group III truncated hemoglobin [Paraburkholderia sp.]|jgi:hemoglobin|nr:group III truncated hemoglobin [Paraburkholderia sp.]